VIGYDEERVMEATGLPVKHRILGSADEPGTRRGERHRQTYWDVLLELRTLG
jgi:hypothetical protein